MSITYNEETITTTITTIDNDTFIVQDLSLSCSSRLPLKIQLHESITDNETSFEFDEDIAYAISNKITEIILDVTSPTATKSQTRDDIIITNENDKLTLGYNTFTDDKTGDFPVYVQSASLSNNETPTIIDIRLSLAEAIVVKDTINKILGENE
jgi:hypothetical protein